MYVDGADGGLSMEAIGGWKNFATFDDNSTWGGSSPSEATADSMPSKFVNDMMHSFFGIWLVWSRNRGNAFQ